MVVGNKSILQVKPHYKALLMLPNRINDSKGIAMTQSVSCQPPIVMAQVQSQAIYDGFVVDKVALGQVFLQVHWFCPVSIMT
jgi:hypothetical protein